jgi:hypothetical protein
LKIPGKADIDRLTDIWIYVLGRSKYGRNTA